MIFEQLFIVFVNNDRTVCAEVHDVSGRLIAVQQLLCEKGFRVNVERQASQVFDDGYFMFKPEELELFLVYGIRT